MDTPTQIDPIGVFIYINAFALKNLQRPSSTCITSHKMMRSIVARPWNSGALQVLPKNFRRMIAPQNLVSADSLTELVTNAVRPSNEAAFPSPLGRAKGRSRADTRLPRLARLFHSAETTSIGQKA